MTGETKVGLVVAASFLCLVGGVFAVKHFRPAAEEGSAQLAAQNSGNEEAPATTSSNTPATETTPPVEPIASTQTAPPPVEPMFSSSSSTQPSIGGNSNNAALVPPPDIGTTTSPSLKNRDVSPDSPSRMTLPSDQSATRTHAASNHSHQAGPDEDDKFVPGPLPPTGPTPPLRAAGHEEPAAPTLPPPGGATSLPTPMNQQTTPPVELPKNGTPSLPVPPPDVPKVDPSKPDLPVPGSTKIDLPKPEGTNNDLPKPPPVNDALPLVNPGPMKPLDIPGADPSKPMGPASSKRAGKPENTPPPSGGIDLPMTPFPNPMGNSGKSDTSNGPAGTELPKSPAGGPTIPPDLTPPPPVGSTGKSNPLDLPSPGNQSGKGNSLDLPAPPGNQTGKPNPVDLPSSGASKDKSNSLDLPPPKNTIPPEPNLPQANGGTANSRTGSNGPTSPEPKLTQPMGESPSMSTNSRPSTPPQPAVAPAAQPRVNELQEANPDTYDEEWYYCKQGDTLEGICQKFFGVTKYAAALRQYNLDRNYTASFRSAQPSFAQGQVVKVPPARVLERKYPNAIPGFHAMASTTMDNQQSGGASGTNATPGTPAASLGPVGRDDLGSPTEYIVPRSNMTLRDIAKEELRNPDEWQRIFLLNRQINPSAAIPQGTKIYLPRPLPRTGP